MKRAEDGIVVITNSEQCTSCQLCVEACPYDAPKIVTGSKINIVKCNLCIDRIIEGRSPACVATCPTMEIGNCRAVLRFNTPHYRYQKTEKSSLNLISFLGIF